MSTSGPFSRSSGRVLPKAPACSGHCGCQPQGHSPVVPIGAIQQVGQHERSVEAHLSGSQVRSVDGKSGTVLPAPALLPPSHFPEQQLVAAGEHPSQDPSGVQRPDVGRIFSGERHSKCLRQMPVCPKNWRKDAVQNPTPEKIRRTR
jgi:hypothetical protein